MNNSTAEKFTKYQIFVIAILTILQFTLILDFMVLSPLGAILMKELSLQPKQFGLVVSAYAFSAGASGLLAAGFADRFDRKKLLLFFYVGFVFGTMLCAIADSYEFLLIARIVTGIFGGVIGSISFAIISDLFKLELRGRVMGYVQMAFSASQILGLPIGLYLANSFGWHSPFWMIVGFSIIVGIAIVVYMQPITEHLKVQNGRNPFEHLWKTLSNPDYLRAFLATILLATGGFMLIPFGSAFSINNLKIDIHDLPMLYLITGIFTIAFGPLSGKLSDKLGKYKVFFVGSIITIIMVLIYTNLGQTPFWLVSVANVLMYAGVTARMISASSLMTAVPQMQDRGAFMSINSSIQQISGGAAAALAGVIVSEGSDGTMQNYPLLGIVVVAAMIITIGMMYILNRQIQKR
ncbi:MAG: MFS transporter [Emticicia sp.]|nr:MFS transporter [Emticicia sp.]